MSRDGVLSALRHAPVGPYHVVLDGGEPRVSSAPDRYVSNDALVLASAEALNFVVEEAPELVDAKEDLEAFKEEHDGCDKTIQGLEKERDELKRLCDELQKKVDSMELTIAALEAKLLVRREKKERG